MDSVRVTQVGQVGRRWDAIGPFAIGTREDVWTTYPIGDIEFLTVSDRKFSSTLCKEAGWKEVVCRQSEDGTTVVEVQYDEVDWKGLIGVYGWSAQQFQCWIRGSITLQQDCVVALQISNSPEFLLDGIRYEGDIYNLRTNPLVLFLTAGEHVLNIRVINEIRIFGSKEVPSATVVIALSAITEEVRISDVIISDRYMGILASSHASVNITNATSESIEVCGIDGLPGVASLEVPLVVAPYQTKAFPFFVKYRNTVRNLRVVFLWRRKGERKLSRRGFDVEYTFVGRGKPHIITFPRKDCSISYAVLRPPLLDAKNPSSDQSNPKAKLPVLLSLHGAGVEASSHSWRDIYTEAPSNTWVLQPSCGKWGDDWHALAQSEIDHALLAIPVWIERNRWTGPSVDLSRIFVTGHSNGAQGAMQFAMRNKHRLLGAAWVAGYTSIQRYVPYTFWSGNVPKPDAWDVVANKEMLRGIDCFVRHGEEDDNVPIYHSRLLKSLCPDFIVEEVRGVGHWWDGCMTSGAMGEFIESHIETGVLHDEISPPSRDNLAVRQSDSATQLHEIVADLDSDPECSKILDSVGPINIYADPPHAHRIAHSLLLYHKMNANILPYHPDAEQPSPKGNIIIVHTTSETNATEYFDEYTSRLQMEKINSDQWMLNIYACPRNIGKVLKLLPWRTGTGVRGNCTIHNDRESTGDYRIS